VNRNSRSSILAIPIVIFICLFVSQVQADLTRDVLGDVNNDGIVNVLDIVRVVNIILENNPVPTDYELWAGDVNADEFVNVQDIIVIVSVIMGTMAECPDYLITCENDLTDCCIQYSSHEITWEFEVFGDSPGNINTLKDGFIINENDIWIVGEYYLSPQPNDFLFNMIHWDGNEWNTTPMEPDNNDYGPYYLYSVFGFAPDDLWTGVGAPVYYNGSTWFEYGHNNSNFPEDLGGIDEMWGVSSEEMYLGMDSGDIIFWDGDEFSIMETSTGTLSQYLDLVEFIDIFGTDSNHMWALSYNIMQLNEDHPITLQFYNGFEWVDQYNIDNWEPIEGEISGTIYNAWAYGDTLYMISGWYGLWKESITTGEGYYDGSIDDIDPWIYVHGKSLVGNHYNDIFTVSWQGYYGHWNGVDWYHGTEIREYFDAMGVSISCKGLHVKDDIIIAYGDANGGQFAWVAKGTRN